MTNTGVTTESGGRQNMFPSETRPYIDESVSYDGYPPNIIPRNIYANFFPIKAVSGSSFTLIIF